MKYKLLVRAHRRAPLCCTESKTAVNKHSLGIIGNGLFAICLWWCRKARSPTVYVSLLQNCVIAKLLFGYDFTACRDVSGNSLQRPIKAQGL
ncbi:hypothetical protein H6F98_06390 [Microcoleus sp. FACHB-SPT15]|uniref:hypothetical protein n=1 Tax=Microcoleus sp. FACHB-SPT15 TaxID=2692830 RepID=UPI001784B3A7|nr:hypothetical protein [Microcoleus sp. FACHB-SPT15]MBD1805079.1 hypothetical protein [Microcoleus sp. FACHB-SPT15]